MIDEQNKLEMNLKIRDSLDNIRFGTVKEKDGFIATAKLLAIPEKALKEANNQKTEYSEYEKDAIHLCSLIICSFMYKNKNRFQINSHTKELSEDILKYLETEKIIQKSIDKITYYCKDYDKFSEWINKLTSQQLPETYTITNHIKTFKINYNKLRNSYEREMKFFMVGHVGKPHPYLFHDGIDFIYKDSFRIKTAIKIMLDGIQNGQMR